MLRATLGEVACAAARTKRSYLSARYRRLAARRGHNRSVVAVGHKILTIVYFIIKDRVTYDDLGEDYHDRQRQEQPTCDDLEFAERLIRIYRETGRDHSRYFDPSLVTSGVWTAPPRYRPDPAT